MALAAVVVVAVLGAVLAVVYVRRKSNTGAQFFDVVNDDTDSVGGIKNNGIELVASSPSSSSTYTVAYAYSPTADDELALRVGETVRVSQVHNDGWATGSILATGASGVFPMSYLTPQDAPVAVRDAPAAPTLAY